MAESIIHKQLVLGELLDLQSFTNVCRTFVDLYKVGLKVFDANGTKLVDMKVASGDLTHLPLLRKLGGFGRPVLLSTGHATPAEIATAIEAIGEGAGAAERRPPIILLHCVSCYPLHPGDANLRVLPALRDRFGLPVGWSDHSPGHTLAVGAVALGACVIEKHFTLDRRLPGPDHQA